MPAMCEQDGKELARLFVRAADCGLQTSLDFCSIDSAANNHVKWANVLSACGPKVMLFAPSIDEIGSAIGPPVFPTNDLSLVSSQLLSFGFAIVVLKLGSRGLYLRSSKDRNHMRMWNLSNEWVGRELFTPSFRANSINTNGAGDCSIAGLITAISGGFSPEQALLFASAVGACSVEAADASSGVLDVHATIARVQNGWARTKSSPPTVDWRYGDDDLLQIWRGPFDRDYSKIEGSNNDYV